MKSQWIFHKLTTHLPSSFSTLKIQTLPQSSMIALNHVGLSLLLSVCGKERLFKFGSSLHATFIKNPECNNFDNGDLTRNVVVIWNSLLSMYSKCGDLSNAVKLFDEMPLKDTVSWNVMISGFLVKENFETGFGFFKTMRKVGGSCNFDKATLTTLLSGCDGAEYLGVTKMMHAAVLCSGYESEVPVGNALITSYFKCEDFDSGYRVFDGMFERSVVTWTAVISGLVQNEFFEDGLKLFMRMHRGTVQPNNLTYLSAITACSGLQVVKEGQQLHGTVLKLGIDLDMCVESALMDLYLKCRSMEDAWKIFESAEVVDEVYMTVILVGFAQNGFEEEAFGIFIKMQKVGMVIDANVVSAVLGIFGLGTSLGLGKQIHSLSVKKGFSFNTFVSNGLINIYSKSGDLEDSIKIFDQMPDVNSITWNSIIAAFARHGDGHRAIEFFHKMRSDGFRPTDVTFLSLLHACSHVGLVEEGMEFLDTMQRDYGITPRTEHYACVVDMFGRAGRLGEARSFIEHLPTKQDTLVWQALLGACGIHGDSRLGEYAAERLFSAAPDSHAPYISLANIFSSEGKWKERARTIKRMKEAGVVKATGISWIEIEKNVHSFVVEDRMHPQSEIIYGVLKELFGHMTDEGYVPDKRFILYYVNQDE